MIVYALVAAVCVGAFLVASIWSISLGRPQLGQFEVLVSTQDVLRVRTDLGVLEIDASAGRVRHVGERSSRVAAIADVARVEIRLEETRLSAVADWLMDLGFAGAFGRYRDRVRWHVVELVLDDGVRVPVYAVGELDRREPGWTAIYQELVRLYRRLGWLQDIPGMAAGVQARLLERLPRAAATAAPSSEADLAWLHGPHP